MPNARLTGVCVEVVFLVVSIECPECGCIYDKEVSPTTAPVSKPDPKAVTH
jgi:hypothetical protein